MYGKNANIYQCHGIMQVTQNEKDFLLQKSLRLPKKKSSFLVEA